jgi:hypothetical protein
VFRQIQARELPAAGDPAADAKARIRMVLPSSSVAGSSLKLYMAIHYSRVCLRQFRFFKVVHKHLSHCELGANHQHWMAEAPQYGTLLSTAETFINQSAAGYFAEELAQSLHVKVHDALLQLVRQDRIGRQQVSGLYLYTSASSDVRRTQLLKRRTSGSVPVLTDFSRLEIPPHELKAAIVLFYSLLDEQQRRLLSALESLRLGRGGDSQLADFLGIDAHTVARGRQQLLDQDVEIGRMRRAGAGRKPVEKKRLK